jgi:hypothetical protein
MGADLHAVDGDQQAYFDDPLPFLAEHGHAPGFDVTHLRDTAGGDGGLPEYVVELLYGGAMDPEAALAVADAMELAHRDGDLDRAVDHQALELVTWLRAWAGERGSAIDGMH